MLPIKKIGSVVHDNNATEGTFGWTIPNFKRLFRPESSYSMPDCYLLNSNWTLNLILRHTCNMYTVNIKLYQRSGNAGTINYTLELKRSNGVDEKIVSQNGKIGKDHSFSCEWNIKFQEEELIPYESYTIVCKLKREQLHLVKNINISSRATQTEFPCGVTQEENNPRSEEPVSFEAKGFELLSKNMKELLINGNDFDLKICVKNKEFPVHRNIIKARSPVFAMMLSHDTKENNTGTINIEDCDADSFDEFLVYVYTGKTENLTPSKALNLYYVADKYDFPILKELCVKLLKTSLCVTSICDVILLAAKHEEKELLEAAKNFFAQNANQILKTVEWLRFLTDNPVEANELYISSLEILFNRN